MPPREALHGGQGLAGARQGRRRPARGFRALRRAQTGPVSKMTRSQTAERPGGDGGRWVEEGGELQDLRLPDLNGEARQRRWSVPRH